ncbi:MAG: hypothetical protein R6U86_09960 [Bacteroidales bacterium]
MKKFGLVFLVIAFLALVLVSVSSNDSNSRVNQRTGNRVSSPSSPGFTPPAPQGSSAQATAGGSQEAPRLNPPHGQPGHICEIPVGSPLPSSSGTTAPAGSSTGSQPVATTTPTPSGETRRLNPPHGQPGHICEIPVGSPLPASSDAAAGGAASSVQSVQTTTAAPTANGDNPRLNPPHGQPGHICEIPVGSPLPASNEQ